MDIKPDNVLLDDLNRLALIDLGHAQVIGRKIIRESGTRGYRPAEILKMEPYDVAPADIYSLAVTIIVIMIQNVPFGLVNQSYLNQVYSKQGTKELFWEKIYKEFRPTD